MISLQCSMYKNAEQYQYISSVKNIRRKIGYQSSGELVVNI